MSDGYELDPTTLEAVAGKLRNASTTLSGVDLGQGPPDAGNLTDLMAGVMTKLVNDTSELVAGAGAAGDQVAKARQEYLDQEQRVREDLSVD
ncbi:hypothetical protein [Saccharomonospora glauca]|jgi:hypothetical protein|uniref:Uncharacterized protein n=1 Tax=Saccharomonospora glauca K62 TaxID=928724 RepID=I1D2L9_9PSEU|nr:hypothetical protein [Saccharomonospora glauca]EIE99193.1 hypothetical protein SacglDRAFT_02298 [Saccharomonospora glauca K62]